MEPSGRPTSRDQTATQCLPTRQESLWLVFLSMSQSMGAAVWSDGFVYVRVTEWVFHSVLISF